MSEYKLKTPKAIEKAVTGSYQKIERGVVGSYQKVEAGVVGAYKKIEQKFVDTFLEKIEDKEDNMDKMEDAETKR